MTPEELAAAGRLARKPAAPGEVELLRKTADNYLATARHPRMDTDLRYLSAANAIRTLVQARLREQGWDTTGVDWADTLADAAPDPGPRLLRAAWERRDELDAGGGISVTEGDLRDLLDLLDRI